MLIHTYLSVLGRITIASDGEAVTGLWFEGQKYDLAGVPKTALESGESPVISETRRWLDDYFAGRKPDFSPRLLFHATPFRELIWRLLLEIPYGKTRTYGEIAREAAIRTGRGIISPRAVGGAIGRNPISLLIPCHRVIAADGSLTGYAGGIERKQALLRLEQEWKMDDCVRQIL